MSLLVAVLIYFLSSFMCQQLYGPWNKVKKFNFSSSFESNNCNLESILTSVPSTNEEIIPEAHFDWINSGLINPLQGTFEEKQSLHNLKVIGVSDALVTKRTDVLTSLPNLTFIKSTYINSK